jgi:hypothetical protein
MSKEEERLYTIKANQEHIASLKEQIEKHAGAGGDADDKTLIRLRWKIRESERMLKRLGASVEGGEEEAKEEEDGNAEEEEERWMEYY